VSPDVSTDPAAPCAPAAGLPAGIATGQPCPGGTADTPPLGDTVGRSLARAIAAHPDRDALVDVPSGRRWTYARLGEAVDEVARGLLAMGVAKGDRVGIRAVNCPEWVLVQYASARMGAATVTIDPACGVHELSSVLDRAAIDVLFSSTDRETGDRGATAERVRPDRRAPREVVHIGDESWDRFIEAGRVVTAERLAEREARLRCDDPVNIQYPSDTAGFAESATLSHHTILNNGFFVGDLIAYTEKDRICLPVPFHHCFGMVMGNLGATSHAACIVIPAPTFDPAATLRAVEQERCTSLYGVPTMFVAELSLPDFASYDLSSLRTGVMTGSPCSLDVMKRVVAEMHMAEVSICYGMTEPAPCPTPRSTRGRRDEDPDRRSGAAGPVPPAPRPWGPRTERAARRSSPASSSRAPWPRSPRTSPPCSATAGSSVTRPETRATSPR
jgi:fatty-acyl-CoA synthase